MIFFFGSFAIASAICAILFSISASRHNGWVQVEGRKGEGACFTIHIPLYQGDEQQRGQKSQKSRGKSRKDQK